MDETAIALWAMRAQWAGVIVAALALGAAVWAGVTIKGQLVSMRWTSLLTLEQDMANRRREFLTIVETYKKATAKEKAVLEARYTVEKESYFNSLDRLASSVLNGNFPEPEMKQDYRDYINGVVKDFSADFAAGTPYRKILKLYENWQD